MKSFVCLIVAISSVLGSRAEASDRSSELTGFEFALYYAPTPTADPEETLSSLLADKYRQISALDPTSTTQGSVTGKWVDLENYAPPTKESLRYLGRGLDEARRASIAQSERVFIVGFQAPRQHLNAVNKLACELVADLADATAGIPWDEECRLIYSAETWRSNRVDTWQENLPDVRAQINMHAYRDPELLRVVTLGMRKFGLPDLVIDELPSGHSRGAGNTINACAQLLLEGRQPTKGKLLIELDAIRHNQSRASALENPEEGAKGKVVVRFEIIERDEGDPENRLWKLTFDDAVGTTATERTLDGFTTLFGSTDKVVYPKNDAALQEASKRARAAFFAKEKTFRKGFGPNERLLVKKAFTVSEGKEYMWVEVIGWEKKAVLGILANDSSHDTALRHGKRVTVDFADVYDYLYYKADGSEEGNETGKILAQEQNS